MPQNWFSLHLSNDLIFVNFTKTTLVQLFSATYGAIIKVHCSKRVFDKFFID